jgi:hypothetical protein
MAFCLMGWGGPVVHGVLRPPFPVGNINRHPPDSARPTVRTSGPNSHLQTRSGGASGSRGGRKRGRSPTIYDVPRGVRLYRTLLPLLVHSVSLSFRPQLAHASRCEVDIEHEPASVRISKDHPPRPGSRREEQAASSMASLALHNDLRHRNCRRMMEKNMFCRTCRTTATLVGSSSGQTAKSSLPSVTTLTP